LDNREAIVLIILKRSILWAFTGGIVAVVLWSLVGGALALLYSGRPFPADMLRYWPHAVLSNGVGALLVAAIAVPVYVVVLAGWQMLLRVRPEFDATSRRRVWSALVLASPLVAVLALSFAGWVGPSPISWVQAAPILGLALVSCWVGVYLPRLLFRPLRASLEYGDSGAR
jgi:hypothetical protein